MEPQFRVAHEPLFLLALDCLEWVLPCSNRVLSTVVTTRKDSVAKKVSLSLSYLVK